MADRLWILVHRAPYGRIHAAEAVRHLNGAAAQGPIRGVVASFVGMLLSLLVRFGSVALIDLPSIVLSAGAFAALLRGVDFPVVVAAGLGLSLSLS